MALRVRAAQTKAQIGRLDGLGTGTTSLKPGTGKPGTGTLYAKITSATQASFATI